VPHKKISEILDGHRERFRSHLTRFLRFTEELSEVDLEPSLDPSLPHWRNAFLPGLDAVGVYGMMADARPRLVLEIGSGHSTKFLRYAIRRRSLNTRLVSIDPNPRAEIDALCDEIVRSRLEDTDLDLFGQVSAGDIVFFDGSHRVFMNSDVVVFFLEVVPSLPAGVLVQVHDILLPFDYPPGWIERYYSEQYLIAAQLLAPGCSLQIELANSFITHDPELSQVLNPLWQHPRLNKVDRFGGSFWFRTS
jgi:hypothetical protein